MLVSNIYFKGRLPSTTKYKLIANQCIETKHVDGSIIVKLINSNLHSPVYFHYGKHDKLIFSFQTPLLFITSRYYTTTLEIIQESVSLCIFVHIRINFLIFKIHAFLPLLADQNENSLCSCHVGRIKYVNICEQ